MREYLKDKINELNNGKNESVWHLHGGMNEENVSDW
jgi:hypothetical protein